LENDEFFVRAISGQPFWNGGLEINIPALIDECTISGGSQKSVPDYAISKLSDIWQKFPK
jgi:hypothetical protein